MNKLERAIRLLAQKMLQSNKKIRPYAGEYEALVMFLQYLCACPGHCVLNKNIEIPFNYLTIASVNILGRNRYTPTFAVEAEAIISFSIRTIGGLGHFYFLELKDHVFRYNSIPFRAKHDLTMRALYDTLLDKRLWLADIC